MRFFQSLMKEKEEDIFPTPPEAPLPSFWQRVSSSMYFWWMCAFFLMAVAVFLISSQCSTDALNFPQSNAKNLDVLPFLDQEKDLQLRADGLWYEIGKDIPFDGVAVTFHSNGQKKSRVQYKDGLAFGLIEQWEMNGTSVGPRFKGEFAP